MNNFDSTIAITILLFMHMYMTHIISICFVCSAYAELSFLCFALIVFYCAYFM